MKLTFLPEGWAHYVSWHGENEKMLARINELIMDAMRSPFRGIGKPEPLRDNWAGWWSRRIDGEHRLVYRVHGKGEEQVLEIAQCRFHYGKR